MELRGSHSDESGGSICWRRCYNSLLKNPARKGEELEFKNPALTRQTGRTQCNCEDSSEEQEINMDCRTEGGRKERWAAGLWSTHRIGIRDTAGEGKQCFFKMVLFKKDTC